MRLGHFDINLLLALDALLDTKSVTVSADRLNMGQSAMSSALGRLRLHFGDELLVKVGRGLELTPYAQSLKAPVQDALAAIRQAVTVRHDFNPQTAERRFVIRATDYLVSTVLTDVMRRLEREAPGVTLSIGDLSEDLPELLNRGEIDLVMGNLDYVVADHPREYLFKDESVVVADRTNPLTPEGLTMAQFLKLSHVAVQVGSPQTERHEAWLLGDRELKRRISVTVTRFNALPQFIIDTERVGMTHRRHAEWWRRHFPIKILELPFEVTPISIYMQWNKNIDSDLGHMWLRSIVRETVKKFATD